MPLKVQEPYKSKKERDTSVTNEGTLYTRGIPMAEYGNDDVVEPQIAVMDTPIVEQDTQLDIPTGATYNFGDFAPTEYENLINDLLVQSGQAATQEIDRDRIRRESLNHFQDEIDATNTIYTDLLNKEEIESEDRSGSNRAVLNAQGLIGSGRGMRKAEDVRQYNADQEATLQANKIMALSKILSSARAEAQNEINMLRQAKQQGADAYLEYLNTTDQLRSNRVNQAVTYMVNNNISPEDLASNEFNELTRNLGVSEAALRNAYDTVYAPIKEENIASSREAAIVGLVAQGIEDPVVLFDYLNYDEAGNRIGDITLSEISEVTSNLKRENEFFELGQGQARYRVNPDGSVQQVAYNPKTYKPEDVVGGAPQDIPAFDEWAQGATAEQIINDFQEGNTVAINGKEYVAPIEFIAEKQTELLRGVYDEAVAGIQESQRLTNITPSEEGDLEQARLTNAPATTQSYYLNSDSRFKRYYNRQVALGNVPANASLDEIDQIYQDWYAQEGEEGENVEQLLQTLNAYANSR